jgi:hypothetical protein
VSVGIAFGVLSLSTLFTVLSIFSYVRECENSVDAHEVATMRALVRGPESSADVDAGVDELAEQDGVRGRGAESRYDLGSTKACHEFLVLKRSARE